MGETASVLEALAAASREIGVDPALVLHGGGNSSIKLSSSAGTTLWMKPSGYDMGEITSDDFVPLDAEAAAALIDYEDLTNDDLLPRLRNLITGPATADPSVETLVHALIPVEAILHSHADVLLALSDTPLTNEELAEIVGDRVAVMDYASSGLDLAQAVLDTWNSSAAGGKAIDAILVRKHGLFAFASNVQAALEAHQDVIYRAEEALKARGVESVKATALASAEHTAEYVPTLRSLLSAQAGRPVIVRSVAVDSGKATLFEALNELERGPATPDHVNWLGLRPFGGSTAEGHLQSHESFIESTETESDLPDVLSFPRVVRDEAAGFLATVGDDAAGAKQTAEILASNIFIADASQQLGGYEPAALGQSRWLAGWSAQQAKLGLRDAKPMTGQSVLVTGAASGIGKACVDVFLEAGASVVGWDLSETILEVSDAPNYTGVVVNVTHESAMETEIQRIIALHGGLDVVVVAAGIFPEAQLIGDLNIETWRRVLDVNVTSVARLFSLIQPLLAASPCDPQTIVIGSKNVAAPGPGAAAYSASKSALTQLSRVAAMEWAPLGIRVNVVHPNAVFDTALWTPELLEARAAHYGMTVAAYKTNNLLGREVTSRGVAELVMSLCGPGYQATTGAQIPIDGGNERTL
ncbi:SDR family oxidoreductase [Leucobacter sp. gxy201]|uniref:SDR family oxidoreductase n=1 Tax=Leucobacter sp. gxy201 TaxID=2957200 RepID=UPI003DA0DE36